MSKKKLTTGAFFGGLFGRAALSVQVDDSMPAELQQLITDAQDDIRQKLVKAEEESEEDVPVDPSVIETVGEVV